MIETRAGSAITLLNAMHTGYGAAIGIDAEIKIIISVSDELEIIIPKGVDDKLVRSCIKEVQQFSNLDIKCKIMISSSLPHARGMKTSSAVSSALTIALGKLLALETDEEKIMKLAAQASINAGVSITGALDDAYASYYGGLVLTSNKTGEIILHQPIPQQFRDKSVLLIIPQAHTPKSSLKTRLGEMTDTRLHEVVGLIKKR